MKLHNRQHLKDFRKELRNHSTGAEGELWKYLKGGQQQGCKFRRQHSVDNFMLDFYCPAKRLAIELDGQIHFSTISQEYDILRDQALKE